MWWLETCRTWRQITSNEESIMGRDGDWKRFRRGKERKVRNKDFKFSLKGTEVLQGSEFNWDSNNKKNWASYACKVGKCSGVELVEENEENGKKD